MEQGHLDSSRPATVPPPIVIAPRGSTPAAPPFPIGMTCPACSYAASGLQSPVCPECGRTITVDDVLRNPHRQVFLELTRFRPIVRLVVMFSAAAFATLVTGWGAIAFVWLGFGILPGFIAFSGSGLEKQLARRLWWMLLPFTQSIWLVPFALVLMRDFVFRLFWGYSSWLYENASMREIGMAAGIAACGIGYLIHLRSWRRWTAFLALDTDLRSGPRVRLARLATFLPSLLAVAIGVLSLGVMAVVWYMDNYHRGWDMRP